MSARAATFWTFIVTSVAVFMVSLDNLVVTTALPVIKDDLGASLQGLEWTVNAYTLTFAVLLLTGAALGDRFGRKRMFLVGLAVFTLGSALAALAPSIEALIAARALQGVGGAIVTPLTLTILSAAVPPARRGLALGIWGGVSGLAVALGPVVGGAVVEGLSWQWIFWINVPFGIVLLPIAWRRLDRVQGPEPLARPARPRPRQRRPARHRLGPRPRQRARLDAASASPAHRRRHRPARRLRPVGAAHRRADGPAALLPQPRLLGGQRHLAADELRDVRRDLPARPVLPDRAGVLAARGRAAHAALDGDADLRGAHRRHPQRPHRRRPLLVAGMALMAAGLAWMAIVTTTTVAYIELVPAFVMAGVGMTLYFAPVANLVLSTVRRKEEGKASGVNNTIREVGGVFGVAVLASVFSAVGGYASPQTFVDGMVPAIWVGATAVASPASPQSPSRPAGRRARLGLAAGAGRRRAYGPSACRRARL